MTDLELLQQAEYAMQNAYAPYSRFTVGAALEAEDGTVFLGCNVENASYGATICAERTALFTAVANGKRHFKRIAVVGGENGVLSGIAPPCGICRQALSEFSKDGSLLVLMKDGDGNVIKRPLSELLPEAFGLTGKGE